MVPVEKRFTKVTNIMNFIMIFFNRI